MWKLMFAMGFLLLLLAPELQAARCKVDGKWHEYDSPQCNPQAAVEAGGDPPPVNPSPDAEPERQPDLPVLPPLPGVAPAAVDLPPWQEVVHLAEQTCRDRKYLPMGLDCLMGEESAYWAMHGNFAMPESQAAQSKALCAAKTTSFRSQAYCMENESRGYQSFAAASEMPDDKAAAARAECAEKFGSWSQRGECVRTANYRHKYPHGRGKRSMGEAGFAYDAALPGFAKESEVVTFRVQPLERRDVKMVGESPPPPEPLTHRQRAARLAPGSADPVVLQAAVEALEESADYVELSAKVPHVENVADLTFSRPIHVNTSHGVRFTNEENSSVGLTLAVETGRVYLVDFVVGAIGAGSYVLKVGADTHVFEDLGSAIRNVSVRLIPEATRLVGLSLSRPHGKGFTFQTAAITSIEATGLFAPEPVAAPASLLPDQLATDG
ncbi:MAG: hypothetical protein MUE63_10910 [Xanthomonadales bacterium]|nr:hypothetical protein [Xanthomonadales bacterium]